MGTLCIKKKSTKELIEDNLPSSSSFKELDDSLIHQDESDILGGRDTTSSNCSNRSSLKRDPNATLEDFEKLKVLGKGSFGKVLLVKLKTNGKLFAMKILQKDSVVKRKQVNHTKTERMLLEKLKHPFIVKLYYAFQDEENLYFITEFMQGGEMFFHLHRNPQYKDKAVIFYLSEILLAIEYMHRKNYIYRDLKPENVLIGVDGHIKITDFGLSKILSDEDTKTYTMCGTAEYLAPEIILEKGYDKSCDWFSFGALMFEMLCGYHPFPRKGKKIDPRVYMTPIKIPRYLTDEARSLLSKLLEVNPRKRIGYNGADEIKLHSYFKEVDFNKVFSKTYTPPFVPELKDELDLKYFDPGFTSEDIESFKENIVKSHKNEIEFEGFTYQPQDLAEEEKEEDISDNEIQEAIKEERESLESEKKLPDSNNNEQNEPDIDSEDEDSND